MSFVEKLKALLHEAGAEIKAGEEKLKAYVEAAVTAHEDNKDLPTPTPAAATGSVPYMGANPSPKNQRPLPIQRANKETGITEESSPPPVSNAGHAIAADGTDLGTGQNLAPGNKVGDNVVSTTGRLGDQGATADGHKITQESAVKTTNDQLTNLPSLPHAPPGNNWSQLSRDQLLEDLATQHKRAQTVNDAIAKLTPAQQSSSHLPQQRDGEMGAQAGITHALEEKDRAASTAIPVKPLQGYLEQAAAKGWS